MAKRSSSKSKTASAAPVARAPSLSMDIDDAKSEDGGLIDDEAEDTDGDESSLDSNELEDVAPKKRANGASLGGAVGGSSRPGAPAQLPRYQPPAGMMPLNLGLNFANSAFEWDAMASKEGVELWAIRAPSDLKSSRLSQLNVSMGSSGPSGSLNVKHTSYTLRSAGFPTPAHADVDAEGRQPTAGPGLADAMTMDEDGGEHLKFEGGAEMMGGMRLMVPRMKEKGKLFAAVTRQLILVPNTTLSTSASHDNPLPSLLATSALDDALDDNQSISHAPPKRYQPAHLLKFRNFAVGSSTPGPGIEPAQPSTVEAAPDHHVSELAVEGETPKKKRKSGTGESSKKKKVKA